MILNALPPTGHAAVAQVPHIAVEFIQPADLSTAWLGFGMGVAMTILVFVLIASFTVKHDRPR